MNQENNNITNNQLENNNITNNQLKNNSSIGIQPLTEQSINTQAVNVQPENNSSIGIQPLTEQSINTQTVNVQPVNNRSNGIITEQNNIQPQISNGNLDNNIASDNGDSSISNFSVNNKVSVNKKFNPLLIAIPLILALIVGLYLAFNKASSNSPSNNDLKSVQNVITSFVNYIKEENYDKAITLIYGSDAKNSYLPLSDVSVFEFIRNDNTQFDRSSFKYTEKDSEPFSVDIEGSYLSYSVIKVDDKYYIYNFQDSEYDSPSALKHNNRIAILSGTNIKINDEDASKYKIATDNVRQCLMSNMIVGSMYVCFDEKVDIYEMNVGYSFGLSLQSDSDKLLEDDQTGISSNEEKYSDLKVKHIKPSDKAAYDYANNLFKDILDAGFNKKEVSNINLNFNSEDNKSEFIKSYDMYVKNMFEDYTERGGKITVTGYNIDDEKELYYYKLGDNKWLVQIEYKITSTKDYVYSEGRENIIGNKRTTDYEPIIILEKKGNEYYIDYMSELSHVFSDYVGR